MFPTEFTCVNSAYRLIVDSTLAIQTAAWLDRQGVTYDRYFVHEGFCKFIFISAPDKAISLVTAKYPLVQSTTAIAAPQDWSEYQFVKAFDTDSMDNGFWVVCPSPELAARFAAGLQVQTYIRNNQVHFADSDMESTMTPELFLRLVECFGEPSVYWNRERIAPEFEDSEPSYYFADCNTSESVKARYHQLSKLHHPDCGGNSETFIEIADEYQKAVAQFS
jgi:hypothetical protein